MTAYEPGRVRRHDHRPGRHGFGAGTALLTKHFPSSAANPTNLIYKLSQPAWDDPAGVAAGDQRAAASGLFTGVTGPLNPVGASR